MFIYIFILLILIGLAIINPKDKRIKKLVYFLLGIFLCTSYFNGSDWRQYEILYNGANINTIQGYSREKGFYLYILFFKQLGFEFFEFFIINKLIIYYIFYKVIIKSFKFYIVLFLFYSQMAINLFIDCPLRNLLAIGLVLIAIEKWNKKKKIGYFILYITLASLFHKTAAFFIIIPLFYKIIKFSKIKIMIFLFLSYFILLNYKIIITLISYLPLFKERLSIYLETKYSVGEIITLGNIEKILIIVIIVILKDRYRRYGKELSLILLYFLLYRTAITFPILGRLAYYLQIFYILGIGMIISKINKNLNRLVVFLFGIYSIINTYNLINSTYKYIPYTSYISYIGKEKPSYDYRNNYNYIEYVKRNGIDEFIKKYIKK